MLYIGLMSGTSIDAADAALVEFMPGAAPRLHATASLPPPPILRDELLRLTQQDDGVSLRRLGALHERLGAWFADAALAVMAQAGVTSKDIAAIGSHGQTVRHEPDIDWPFSMQLGSASRIAALTGCTVVADFRSADLAVGGQGAPLVPAFHRSVFARPDRGCIVANIGGIANLTLLPAGSDRDDSGVTGFDTGPGNALMDGWCQAHLGTAMDAGGRWAASGRVHAPLLDAMLRDPYLHRAAPKSTGREYFNPAWLQARLDNLAASPTPEDVQATLCEFTARSIADACESNHEEVIVCGGGAHNTQLMARLADLLAPRSITITSLYGMDVNWVEATAFAWLAMRRLEGLPGNLPNVTGAKKPAVLGGIYRP